MSTRYTGVSLVELPFEHTTSFMKGTAGGPAAIVRELAMLDGFDLSLGRNPFEALPAAVVQPYKGPPRDAFIEQAYSSRAVSALLDADTFPICLGGEHTVSIGPVRAARTRGPLGVVQLDAHADLRNTYEGDYFSHACVMRRVLEMDCRVVGIGIRTMCAEEAELVRSRGLRQVDGRTAATQTDWYSIIDDLPERVYLSVDMDVFNPEAVPAVGTPEPGGPGYHDIVPFLEYLFSTKQVVAADVVELMPKEGDAASLRFAARLIGTMVALRFPADP
jgi:agmatinase